MGGLGNQLFQIFTCIAYSLNNKVAFKLPYNKIDKVSACGSLRPTYWKNFLNRLIIFTEKDENKLNFNHYQLLQFHYMEIPKNLNNVKLFGYFQSYKYFENQKLNIFKLMGLTKLKDNIKYKYKDLLNNENQISLHFRLGDYKFLTEHHPILDINYYKNALNYYVNQLNTDNLNILVFFEKEDIQKINMYIKILKNMHNNINFIYCPYNISDWESILLMSLCKHNIIANSSFSWWGAYMNNNDNKIVCYPNKWFGPAQGNKNTDDLFPENWIKISV